MRSKIVKLWSTKLISPLTLAAWVAIASAAQAQDTQLQLDTDIIEENNFGLGQVTNVNQLRDVSPGDWAYEALRNLVETYGCIAGYPDGTYRGNRAMTRYEFAAGLNACLQQIERLIAASTADFVTKDDLVILQRLLGEFEAELATLGTRVDNLEGRVAFLEDHQFSTTTKLTGEVIFGVAGVFAGDDDIDRVTAFGDRVRLELETSFTGEDLLFTRLSAGNMPEFAEETGTFEGEIGFAQPEGNDVGLEVLFYEFPVNDNIRLWLEAAGGAADDFTNTFNFLDGDGGGGAISAFGTRNPIYFPMEEAGLGLQAHLGVFEFSAGYLASEASSPNDGSGLFNGPFSTLAQLAYRPNDNFALALTYIHGYNQLDTGTGSNLANFQSFTEEEFGEAVPVVSDSYGVELTWQPSQYFVVGGWGGLTKATTLDTLEGQIERGTLDIWNWAVTLAFPDFLKEGSTAGLVVGMEPWVAEGIDLPDDMRDEDEDTSFHIEAFYEYALTDNINITPGVIVITSPNFDDNNDTLVIGTVRTTFNF